MGRGREGRDRDPGGAVRGFQPAGSRGDGMLAGEWAGVEVEGEWGMAAELDAGWRPAEVEGEKEKEKEKKG